jgi:hypothetical protein
LSQKVPWWNPERNGSAATLRFANVRNLWVWRNVCGHQVSTSSGIRGHPEETFREENEIVVDRSGGVAVERRRRIGTRHE